MNKNIILYTSNLFYEHYKTQKQEAKQAIDELPQCQPVGQLARQCWEKKVVSAFPSGNTCAIEWEFTVCAYSPFEQGILTEGALGINKEEMKKRSKKNMRKRDSRRPSARGRR